MKNSFITRTISKLYRNRNSPPDTSFSVFLKSIFSHPDHCRSDQSELEVVSRLRGTKWKAHLCSDLLSASGRPCPQQWWRAPSGPWSHWPPPQHWSPALYLYITRSELYTVIWLPHEYSYPYPDCRQILLIFMIMVTELVRTNVLHRWLIVSVGLF